MRAQMFKIAGVKTEKEFYKLFPDEASFMKKHGKAFKKAQEGGFMDKMGGPAGLMTDANNIAGGISGLIQENKQVDVTEQMKQVAALKVRAQASPSEDIEHQYVRPEDIQNTGEEFFPIYGVGTNVLTQNGGEIPKYKHGGTIKGRKYSAKFRKDAKAMGHTLKQHAAHTTAQDGYTKAQAGYAQREQGISGEEWNKQANARSSKQAAKELSKEGMNENMREVYNHPLTQFGPNLMMGSMLKGPKMIRGLGKHAKDVKNVMKSPGRGYTVGEATVKNPGIGEFTTDILGPTTFGDDVLGVSSLSLGVGAANNLINRKGKKVPKKQDGAINPITGKTQEQQNKYNQLEKSKSIHYSDEYKGYQDLRKNFLDFRDSEENEFGFGDKVNPYAVKRDSARTAYDNLEFPVNSQNTGEYDSMRDNMFKRLKQEGRVNPVHTDSIPKIQNGYVTIPKAQPGGMFGQHSTGKSAVQTNVGQNKFKDWFAKGQKETVDEDGNMIMTGPTNGQAAAEFGSKFAGALGIEGNAGGQLGKGIGSAAGKLIPIPGVSEVTGFLGEQLGNALDPYAKKIKKNQAATERSMNQMTGMGVGSQVQGMYSATVQDGGDIPLSGELKTHWGGSAEPVSYNPFLPDGGETVQFNGNMHNGSNIRGQSGIGVSFDPMQNGGSSGASLEVEGGEVATKLPDANGGENVVVYGNLPITKSSAEMLGDTMAAGKKAKNYAKGISKSEETSNRALKKNNKMLADLDVRSSFDKLKLKGLDAMDIGHNMRLKIAADKKQNLASWQKAINETAEEGGIVANDLARGKIKVDKGIFKPSNATTAQYGGEIPIAQDFGEIPGGHSNTSKEEERKTFTTEEIEKYQKENWVLSDDGKILTKKGEPDKEILVTKGDKGSAGESKVIKGSSKTWNQAWNTRDKKLYPASEYTKAQYITEAKRQKAASPEMYAEYEAGKKDRTVVTNAVDPTKDIFRTEKGTADQNMYLGDPTDEEEKKKFGVGDAMAIANGILPYVRPSDQDDFDYRQLYGEMYALSHNKVEPVRSQQYRPQLDVPYDISLQDQRNDITRATRSASKLAGYNPSAQAMIAGQAYDPINKVNAEEFRQNQAMKHNVYSGNRATMNDAQFKNLEIGDLQAQRQSLAKSNTKEANQLALNSVSDKYAKHRLENKTLGIYENMYNYRFGNNNVAQNYNPFAQFNMQGNGNPSSMSPGQQAMYYKGLYDEASKLDKAGKTNDWNGSASQDGGVMKKMNLVKALKNY